MTTILKVIVGSRAHGVADSDSDVDYRGVFVLPTREILALGARPKQTAWVEGVPIPEGAEDTARGKVDDTAWEIGHFLNLAVHCNPTILEVFAAPIDLEGFATEDGERLRALFPLVWNPRAVRDAFMGYGLNQRKKFLDNKDGRSAKYAQAYLRTLYQGNVLLREGWLPVDMRPTPIYDTLRRWRERRPDGRPAFAVGAVIDLCEEYRCLVEEAWPVCPQKPDLGRVNDFLLDVRRRYW